MDLRRDLDSIASAAVVDGTLAGVAAAVVHGADTLLFDGFGMADLELDVPLPRDAIFEIGSVTKQFTAAAALQLVEEELLDLDAALTDYLPGYPLRGNRVTVRHLLNHTSGIRSYTEVAAFDEIMTRRLTRDTLVTLVASEPFDFTPGSAMIYNNSGYFLLGLVIEEVSGMTYEEYVEERLFQPLGMERSSYCRNSDVIEGRARGYAVGPDGTFRRAAYIDHTWPFAAGSLCSTAGDLVTWLRALHGAEVLSPARYREMTTPDTLADGHRLRYAMGLAVEKDAAGRARIHHGGAIFGFLSETRYYPADDLFIVVLTNTLGRPGAEEIANALAERVLGPAPTTSEARRYSGDLGELTGTYVGPVRGRTLSVTIGEAAPRLVAIENDRDTLSLRYGEGETFLTDPDRFGVRTYAFVRDRGKVAELHVDVGGGHFVLERRGVDPLAELWTSRIPRTSMVTVDGHDVRIRTAAPHPDRIPGRPLVVLEAGFGSTVGSWGPFIEQIAGFAPVLAYERPGIGESEWDGKVPTFEHIAGRLRRLLKEVGAEPPYVLVGHSFGGDLVRFFADFHPEETAGLVLLDPVTNNADDFLAALEEIGAGEEEYWEVRARMTDIDLPPGARAENEMMDRFALHGEELELPRPTQLPVSILFAGLDVPPEGEHDLSFDVGRHVQALERRKIARLGEWIMQVPEGEMTIIPSSGHFVHRDEPELALEAVRSVVYPELSRALSRVLENRGVDAAVALYHDRKQWYPSHRFHEELLNQLGYRLLRYDRTEDAIAIFQLNVREYPGVPNPHDSLADAYREAGRWCLSEASYARAVELAESMEDRRLEAYRRKLGEVRGELRRRGEECGA